MTVSIKLTIFTSNNNMSFTKRFVFLLFYGRHVLKHKNNILLQKDSTKLLDLQVPVDNSVVVY